jgi:hypothetical protein
MRFLRVTAAPPYHRGTCPLRRPGGSSTVGSGGANQWPGSPEIAGSIGVLFLAFQFDGRTAAIAALAALVSMAVYNAMGNRPRDCAELGDQIADLLARSGIDLIAERIENESTVLDLLDYDVRFGQGFLFSQPRSVRAEALQAGEIAAPAA